MTLYQFRKENGLCTRCGKPMDREGCMCFDCLEKHNRIYRHVKDFPKSTDPDRFIEDESWKKIDHFPSHEISNKGRVRNKNSKRLIKPYIRRLYESISIRKPHETIAETLYIHRLVAEAFIPNPNDYPQVNHIDGNKLNNNVENLEWCTCSMNIKHAYDNGLKFPIDHPNKKEVLQIDKNNKVIAKYKSIGEAKRITGIGHISEVISDKSIRKTAGGYYWRINDD